MRSAKLVVPALLILVAAGCGDEDGSGVWLTFTESAGPGLPGGVAEDGGAGPEDVVGGLEDADAVAEDAAGEETADDAGPGLETRGDDGTDEGTMTGDEGGDAAIAPHADGGDLVARPDDLEGAWLFGLGAEPGSPLTSVGTNAAGVIALAAHVGLTGGVMEIRVADPDTLEPVQGGDGLIESYPYEELAGGLVRVDLSAPLTSLEIQMWQSCVYRQQAYSQIGSPALADGLWTWMSLERYESQNCGNYGLQDSLGVNVHFLRRFDANPTYTARQVDPESPFGFFQVEIPGQPEGRYMTRMPHVGGGAPDGSITYYLAYDFPFEYRQAVEGVFEGWNDVLEEAAGSRPFVLEDATSQMVAWDPRYRMVTWDKSSSAGAIAPFVEDPYTGELFETYVLMWLGDLEDTIAKYRSVLEDNPAFFGDLEPEGGDAGAVVPPADWNDDRLLAPKVLRRRLLPRRPLTAEQVRDAIRAVGGAEPPTDEELAAYIVADFLTHEIGHNLGLRHNFKGSLDRDHHPDGASATTTMDYVVGMITPGTYDRDAMRYAYGESAPDEQGYAYCTDEQVEIDPGCARWDFGHPVLYQLGQLQALMDENGPGTSSSYLDGAAEQGEWGKLFRRVRQFVGTDYELWEPGEPVDTFGEVLEWVICAEPCGVHTWFRNQLALHLLYTRYAVPDATGGGDWTWYDFPGLDEAQQQSLWDAYFTLIADAAQPMELKKTIIDKLPTSAVPGAAELLDQLAAWLEGIASPTADEQTLLSWVSEAQQQ